MTNENLANNVKRATGLKSGKLGKILAIGAIVVAIGGYLLTGYNGMVEKEEEVKTAWGQVENVYQRRSDLIPNLVSVVKGYAAHEQNTFEAVTNARSKATQITVDPSDLSEEKIAEFQKAQGEVSSALGRLMMIHESYPELKANENFKELQSQLEGTENRIATERERYNVTAKEYNTFIRKFPKNLIASIFGFKTKGYFEAEEGAEKAPKIEF